MFIYLSVCQRWENEKIWFCSQQEQTRDNIWKGPLCGLFQISSHNIFAKNMFIFESFSKWPKFTNAPHISIIKFREYSVIIGSFHTQVGSCWIITLQELVPELLHLWRKVQVLQRFLSSITISYLEANQPLECRECNRCRMSQFLASF